MPFITIDYSFRLCCHIFGSVNNLNISIMNQYKQETKRIERVNQAFIWVGYLSIMAAVLITLGACGLITD